MLIHHDVFHIFREPHIFASTHPDSSGLPLAPRLRSLQHLWSESTKGKTNSFQQKKWHDPIRSQPFWAVFYEGCPGGKPATLQLQRLQKNLIKKMDKYTLVSYGQNSGISRMRGEQQTWRMAHFSAVLAKISWVSSECASQPRAIKQRLRSTRQLTS